jgi:phage protein D/phage baseplate assembly protein gpV
VNGVALTSDQYNWVTLVSVRLGLDTSAHARVEFQSEGADPAPFAVGKALVVKLSEAGKETMTAVFEGTVMGVGCEMGYGHTRITVDAYDASYRLGRATKVATHVESTYADAISQIAQDYGLQSEISGLPTTVFETLQQYGTPQQFIGRIVRATGCEWTVTGKKLIVRPRTAMQAEVELTAGEALMSFQARYTASEESASVELRGWDPVQQQEIVGTATQPTVGTATSLVDASKTKAEPGDAVAWTRTPVDASHATAMATALRQRMDDSRITGRGETDCDPRLVPGSKVRIKNLGSSFSGTYRVAEVEHLLAPGNPTVTRFTVGASEPTSLVDLLGESPAPSSEHFLGGVTVGVVTNLADPKEHHRVKLKLPYLTASEETGWARVLQLGAGNGRGWWLHPDVGDEVIVAFENGDPRLPVVIGGVWSSANAQPTTAALVSNKLQNRSFTSAKKHVLNFDDGDASAIEIKHGETNTLIRFHKDSGVLVDAVDQDLELKNKQGSIKLAKSTGDITMETKGKLTIKATQDVTIEGMNVNLKSTANTKVEAGAMLEAKASAMAKIDGGNMTEIKAAMVKIN